MDELVEKRTLNSKTYVLDEEQKSFRLVSYRENIHYTDSDGNLKDIDTSILNNKVNKCDYSVELYSDKIGYFGTDPKGKKVELELINIAYKEPTIEGNTAIYTEIEQDVDLKIIFLPRFIRINRILKTDNANKTAVYRSYRESGAYGKLFHKGVDNGRRNTKITIVETEGSKNNEIIITQTFDNKVMKIDKITRRRIWTTDVQYPVVIDPTSTFSIAANADDGMASKIQTHMLTSPPIYSTINNAVNYHWMKSIINTGTYGFLKYDIVNAWIRFSVSGIPQGSTITSATFKGWYIVLPFPTVTMTLKAKKLSNPANPTTVNQVLAPGTLANAIKTSPLSQTIGYMSMFPTKNGFNSHNTDVTAIVQELVNAFDYTASKHMLFFMKTATITASFAPQAYLYHRDWGTSKDAQLIIDYVSAGPSFQPRPPGGLGTPFIY